MTLLTVALALPRNFPPPNIKKIIITLGYSVVLGQGNSKWRRFKMLKVYDFFDRYGFGVSLHFIPSLQSAVFILY